MATIGIVLLAFLAPAFGAALPVTLASKTSPVEPSASVTIKTAPSVCVP